MTHDRGGIEVVMPKLGLTMTEATLVEWHVEEGQQIAKGDLLFTLETAKSALDIEAPASGIVRLRASEGATVPVKRVVAVIEQRGEPVPRFHEGSANQREGTESFGFTRDKHAIRNTEREICNTPASPRARKLARERGIALEDLSGTGPRGMIVVADVEGAAEEARVRATPVARRVAEHLGVDLAEVSGSGPRGRITRADVEAAVPATAPQPLDGLRAIIAERLAQSWRERPQATLVAEVEATNLVNLREQLNAELESRLSYNAFLVKAAALALQDHPRVNVQLTDEGLIRRERINVGLAVDTERGLMVPVLRDADAKPLRQIDAELRELTHRALEGRSLPDALTGGSLTVTNLGMYEIDLFTPIVNPPESAILAVGRIAPRPVVVDGEVVARETLMLSLSFDHRVLDGAPAARFLQRIKRLLERPAALLL